MTAAHHEESYLHQKSRIQWTAAGDLNTDFFHRVINGRRNSKKIASLIHDDGTRADTTQDIQDKTVNFYKQLLGTKSVHY